MLNNTIAVYQGNKINPSNENICPINSTLNVLTGKWKMPILWQLHKGVKRFGELKFEVKNITSGVLSQQLNLLAQEGIIDRKLYAEVPPKVEYSLTASGKLLINVLVKMESWGLEHLRTRDAQYKPECVWNELSK